MSKDNFTTDEERVFDVVLDEALGGVRPPDLSCEILARFYKSPVEAESTTRPAKKIRQGRGKRNRAMRVSAAIVAVGSLAALFAAVVALQPDHDLSDGGTTLADNQNDASNIETDTTASAHAATRKSKERQVKQKNPNQKPPRGIQMMVQTPKLEETRVDLTQNGSDVEKLQVPADLMELALVSAQVEAELQGYWDAIGIKATTEAPLEETAARLAVILGTEVSIQSVANVEQLQGELAQSVNAESVATRWLEQITDRGSARIDAELRAKLVKELASCFQTGSSFDATLAGWLSGKSMNSSAFYAALSSGQRSASGEHGMARRLASLTMNVDLRCTRCHDAYIEGNGLQSDYWSFSAFLKRGVERDPDGNVKIDAASSSAKSVFYELSDGRQRVADPMVPSNWMKSSDAYKQLRPWSEGLIGSPELARGVVNSLWQLVHGQPLHGRVVDPITAPHNEALQRLEEQLTQDLIESKFSLPRILALVIASPATRRAVPESLLPENVWASNQAETKAAMSAVDAFAAALPTRMSLPASQRMDQVMRSIGAKIDMTGKESLGQFGENSKSVEDRKNANSLSADFPAKAEALPVQWLKLINDSNSQIEHLGYLAGQNEVPPHVIESIEAMKEAEVDSNLLLHRVWWLMKP